MLMRCPTCQTKARIGASEQLTTDTRQIYFQCMNLLCGITFVAYLSVDRIIKSPKEGSEPLNKTLQPELAKNPRQGDLLLDTPQEQATA